MEKNKNNKLEIEEIKELEEEHLYNSWYNSAEKSDKVLSEFKSTSRKLDSNTKFIMDFEEKSENDERQSDRYNLSL